MTITLIWAELLIGDCCSRPQLLLVLIKSQTPKLCFSPDQQLQVTLPAWFYAGKFNRIIKSDLKWDTLSGFSDGLCGSWGYQSCWENMGTQRPDSFWRLEANDLNISNLSFLVNLLPSGKYFHILRLHFLHLSHPSSTKKRWYDCSGVSHCNKLVLD